MKKKKKSNAKEKMKKCKCNVNNNEVRYLLKKLNRYLHSSAGRINLFTSNFK